MKILLVDDDVSIIQALLPALKSVRGYQVRAAISGEKAMESAEAWEGVDLLVTDVFMNPMNGITLRNKLRNLYPSMRTVFVTGYDVTSYDEHIEDCEVFIKPIDPHKLVRAIAEMKIRPPVSRSVPRTVGGTIAIAVPKSLAIPETGLAAGTKPFLPKAAPATQPEPEPEEAPAPTPTPEPVAESIPEPVQEPAPEPELEPAKESEQTLVGTTIGDYQIHGELGSSRWGGVFQALQISMNREVAMEILSPALAEDSAVKQQFMANASVKANVQHPFVLAVYEAGDEGGFCYYTSEYIAGTTLASLAAAGRSLDEPTALATVRGVAEALSYFHRNNIPYGDLDSTAIYLGWDNKPRLANLATQEGGMPEACVQINTLAQIIMGALPGGQASGRSLRSLLTAMQAGGNRTMQTWEALIQYMNALEPKAIPMNVAQLKAQEEAKLKALDDAIKRQKRQVQLSVLSLILLVLLTAVAVYVKFFRSTERVFDTMIKVPAGSFIFQDGQKENLPDFWIDKNEVTMGQYAKFLDYLTQHPDEATKFDHPNQAPGKSHVPFHWEIFYPRAKASRPVKFLPIDLNCPVFNVDWWDAYAYAKWKGHRLPTEREWEKAGRGTDGRLYPWGNDWDPKKCNSSADYVDNAGPNTPAAAVDGYIAWSPVDAIPADTSPYGVVGMAGNVSEWTGSWDESGKFPIICGGNYHSPDNKLTHRIATLDPEGISEALGFRTVSDQPPAKKP